MVCCPLPPVLAKSTICDLVDLDPVKALPLEEHADSVIADSIELKKSRGKEKCKKSSWEGNVDCAHSVKVATL
jgi:uncharacterized membrane protein